MVAAPRAISTEVVRAPRQPSSAKIWPYQASEKPSGGKVRLRFSLIETPAMTTMGAAMNSPTAAKNRRVRNVPIMPRVPSGRASWSAARATGW